MFKNNSIKMLELTMNSTGTPNVIYPTLFVDEDHVVLIDTGYPGQLKDIRESIEKAGVSFEKLNNILITHQDIDHIGSLSAILEESTTQIEVFASEIEKPYIQGEKMILRITPEAVEKAVDSLPAHVTEEFRVAFKHRLENPPSGRVDHVIVHNDELNIAGGVLVIDTAGHTPGHLSFYHKESKTLIAGDALIVVDGQLYPSNPNFTLDIDTSLKSIETLLSYDIEKIICYHGGLYEGNVKERLKEICKCNSCYFNKI